MYQTLLSFFGIRHRFLNYSTTNMTYDQSNTKMEVQLFAGCSYMYLQIDIC